jgi:hypothetical protein
MAESPIVTRFDGGRHSYRDSAGTIRLRPEYLASMLNLWEMGVLSDEQADFVRRHCGLGNRQQPLPGPNCSYDAPGGKPIAWGARTDRNGVEIAPAYYPVSLLGRRSGIIGKNGSTWN